MKIREFRQSDLGDVKKITKRLHPKWFTKEALGNIPIDVRLQKSFVAEDKNKVVGFMSIYSRDGEAEIGWMGVDPDLHGRGIGRRLLKRAEKNLREIGVKVLRVETVGEASPQYKPYQRTIKFYEACGFGVKKKSRLKEEAGYKYRMYTLKKILLSP